jgi:hypothetical protein
MRLVDSGSTKADWIAIDEMVKFIYNTNTWVKLKFGSQMKLLND